MGWDSIVSHPFSTGNAVVLLVAEATVVAEVSSRPRHIFVIKELYRWCGHECIKGKFYCKLKIIDRKALHRKDANLD